MDEDDAIPEYDEDPEEVKARDEDAQREIEEE